MEVRLRADPQNLLLASPSRGYSRIRQLPASVRRFHLGRPSVRPCVRSRKPRRKLSVDRALSPPCALGDVFGTDALLAAAAAAATFSVARLVYLSQARRGNRESESYDSSFLNASRSLSFAQQNENMKDRVKGYDSLVLEDAYNNGHVVDNKALQTIPADGSNLKGSFTHSLKEEGNMLTSHETTISGESHRPLFEVPPLEVADNGLAAVVGMTSIVDGVAIPCLEEIDIIKELLLGISGEASSANIFAFPESRAQISSSIFGTPVNNVLRKTVKDNFEMKEAASLFEGVSPVASSDSPLIKTVQTSSAVSGVTSPRLLFKSATKSLSEISQNFTLQDNTSVKSQEKPLKQFRGLTNGFQLAEDGSKSTIPLTSSQRDIAVDNYRVNKKRYSKGNVMHKSESNGDTKNSQDSKLHLKNADDPYFWLSHYNNLLRKTRLKECVDLLEDMERKGHLDMNKVYHARFLKTCKTQKAVKEAFRFTKLIKDPTLSTYNMLLSVYASSQDYEGAVQVLLLVKHAGLKPDCQLYTTLISTCSKSGKVDAMFEVFHEMVNAGVEPNIHTYGALIDGCARAGQVAKAFGAYGIMRSKNVKPDRVIFNALITACGQSGAVDRAFDVLAEMLAETEPIEPDHVTVGALMKTCIQAGKADRAREVYKMLHYYKIKGTPDVYTIAVNSCSVTGDLEFALSIYSDMERNGINPDELFLSSLVDVAGHAGRIDAAFQIFHDAKRRGLQLGKVSYSSLMGACSKAKDWKKALQLHEEIKSIKLQPTVSTMNALITSLCDGDQLRKAIDIFHEMKKAGICPNTITYSILVVACEQKDELELGFDLFSQMEEDGVLPDHIICQCLTGLCLQRYAKAYSLGEPIILLNSGSPTIDCKWTTLAMKVYRQTVSTGVIPSSEVFSNVLGCLKFPNDTSLRTRFVENLGVMGDDPTDCRLYSLLDGFGEYDPRAFSIVEEASSLGVVPSVSLKDGPVVVDVRKLQLHTAEVYLLTVLKGLKHRLAAGARLQNVYILLPVEQKKVLSMGQEKMINISGRVGQAVAALLRRLKLAYQGDVSCGKIRVNGLSLSRWFKPNFTFLSHGVTPTGLGSSQSRLSKEITSQQRSIRLKNLDL